MSKNRNQYRPVTEDDIADKEYKSLNTKQQRRDSWKDRKQKDKDYRKKYGSDDYGWN